MLKFTQAKITSNTNGAPLLSHSHAQSTRGHIGSQSDAYQKLARKVINYAVSYTQIVSSTRPNRQQHAVILTT